MANVNKCIFIGNVTKDIQMSVIPNSGTDVADFGIAVNRKWKQDDQEKTDVMFLDCRCFGKQAGTLNKYVAKGDPIYLEGRLIFETWQDKQTQDKKSKHRLVVESFQFLSNGKQAATKADSDDTGF